MSPTKEQTSKRVAKIAAKILQLRTIIPARAQIDAQWGPSVFDGRCVGRFSEVVALAASCLTQTANRPLSQSRKRRPAKQRPQTRQPSQLRAAKGKRGKQ